MIWWIYNLVFPVVYLALLPGFLLRMLRRGGYRKGFLQRFGVYGAEEGKKLDAEGRPVWIQAVSVGEVAVAKSFMREMRALEPGVRFVLTTNTSTGYAQAKAALGEKDAALYFPVDFPWAVRRALKRIRPKALVLVENEMWPNVIRQARRGGVPVVMVNGRISEHSYRNYRKIGGIVRRLLAEMTFFCAQSEGDAARLKSLGADPVRVEVAGSAKYDLGETGEEAKAAARKVLEQCGGGARRVLAGGSTWDGEEAALLDYYVRARERQPELLLVLVPRHAERREAVLAAIRERGLAVLQRSTMEGAGEGKKDVLLVDTTGELRGFYAKADVVFVGKSLTQKGGQNPIEPAKDGRAVVVGPHMENFPGIMEDFLAAGALVQVADAAGLEAALDRLLGDAEERGRLGAAAKRLVTEKAGATRRMAERVWAASQPSKK